MKKGQKWNWGPEQQKAFELLKSSMAKDVTLASLDYSKEIIMKCDASEHGLGAVLVQKDEKGVERPVAFISKSLKKYEEECSHL